MTKQEIKETWALWKIRATIYCVFDLIHCRKWADNLARLEPWLFRLQERLEDTLPKPPAPPTQTRRSDGQIGNKNALPFPTNLGMGMETAVLSMKSEAIALEQLGEAFSGEVVPGLDKNGKTLFVKGKDFFLALPNYIKLGHVEFLSSKNFQKRMKRRKIKTSMLVRKLVDVKKDKKK
jgi:hypothetical protein